MNSGGLTKRLIDFCLLILRPIRGGLGEVNVVASMLFGGISGSSVADTAALGSILIPSMTKHGYPVGFAAGVTVASSTMGMIIPPSIPMLVYAMISGASVGGLFLAGAVPGLLIGVSQLFVVFFLSEKNGYHTVPVEISVKSVVKTVQDGVFAAVMPLIIILSVSFGIATATESAGIAVLYAFCVGFFVYRELTLDHIIRSLKKTVKISSSIMIIIGFTMIYSWILAVEQVPNKITAFALSLNLNKYMFLVLLDIIILILGTLLDVTPMLLLLCPILIPVVKQFGVGELQFGAIMITGTAIGLATPPVGMCLNVATKLCGLSITEIFRKAFPWLLCNVIILIVVTIYPPVSMWLPSLIK
jgi:tripartite ATP-independent transporter DctM subunit